MQKLVAFDGVSNSNFGVSLSLAGDVLVIGATGEHAGKTRLL